MLGTDIRGIMAEEEEVQRRRQVLKSLLSMRNRQLRESLEQRIKRAKTSGDWMQLSREECATLHKQEKAHLRSQLEQLQHEDDRKQQGRGRKPKGHRGHLRQVARGRLRQHQAGCGQVAFLAGGRPPKIADPTRTMVLPAATPPMAHPMTPR